MWQVVLLRFPKNGGDWRDGYFPRSFHYKSDALALKKEVEDKGGEAEVQRATAKHSVERT